MEDVRRSLALLGLYSHYGMREVNGNSANEVHPETVEVGNRFGRGNVTAETHGCCSIVFLYNAATKTSPLAGILTSRALRHLS